MVSGPNKLPFNRGSTEGKYSAASNPSPLLDLVNVIILPERSAVTSGTGAVNCSFKNARMENLVMVRDMGQMSKSSLSLAGTYVSGESMETATDEYMSLLMHIIGPHSALLISVPPAAIEEPKAATRPPWMTASRGSR